MRYAKIFKHEKLYKNQKIIRRQINMLLEIVING